jgi:hypothetical protein
MEFIETTFGLSKEMPARMAIYGLPKIGKTTFAAQANDAFFINIEGGQDYLKTKVRSTPQLKTFDEVVGWLKHIYGKDTAFCGTIVIDSLDWLEGLSQEKLIKQYNATSITDSKIPAFAYYKGVIEAANQAMDILKWLDAIYKKHAIKAILIAHSTVKEIDLPSKDAFSKYQLKMSKYLSAKLLEWADLILFADYDFFVSEDGKTSEQKRVLRTGNDASFEGGGRMTLKKTIPLDYNQLKKEIENGL